MPVVNSDTYTVLPFSLFSLMSKSVEPVIDGSLVQEGTEILAIPLPISEKVKTLEILTK